MHIPKSLFVIGGGGREHALTWHLRTFYPSARLYCAPGNPGIARIATCLPIPSHDLPALVEAAASLEVSLTMVGPEAPLVAGLADLFAARRLPVLGPTARAGALEGSKAFAKGLMQRYGIPTARHAAFDDLTAALGYIARASGPLVIKADGLAAGKGVVVCDEPDQARDAARAMLADGLFGEAGRRIVIEERLEGEEASVLALVDGEAAALLPAAQDHKRLADGDRGPNTGGMGAAAPYPLSQDVRAEILRGIIEPVARAMCAEGRPYRGVLFAGLMLTPDGPKVLEFNCRLGDPEAQVILPLLPVGLPDAFQALRAGQLGADALAAPDGAAVGVVLASHGYPGPAETGVPIDGLVAAGEEALVFHNGTAERGGRVVTAGGRVVTVVGREMTLAAARARAYRAAASITFEGMHFRHDIGARLPGMSHPADPTAPVATAVHPGPTVPAGGRA